MTIHSAVRFDHDDNKIISLTAGFLGEIDPESFSPDERERQRIDAEREERQIAAEAAARAVDDTPNMPIWAQPPTYSVSERLAAFAAAQEREERREAAQAARQHAPECGCTEQCGNKGLEYGAERTPKRLGSVVDKELAEAQAEFLARPATVGDVAHLAADLGKVKRLLRRKG